MGDRTAIEWTQATWNPVTGCDRTSPGCDHCYALRLAARLKAMGQPHYQRDGNPATSGPGFGVGDLPPSRVRLASYLAPTKARVRQLDERPVPSRRTGGVHTGSLYRHGRGPTAHLPSPDKAFATAALAGKPARMAPEVWIGVSVENARYRFRIA